ALSRLEYRPRAGAPIRGEDARAARRDSRRSRGRRDPSADRARRLMDSWSIGKVLAWASQDLRERGSSSARLDAELLLAQVLHCDRIKLITDSERPLEPAELA